MLYISYKQTGFSLIEVLVALCLMAIMLLGLEKFQLASMQSCQQGLLQTQAIEQLQTMANLIQLTNGKFSTFVTGWNKDNKILLPDGAGEIKQFGNKFTAYLYWRAGKSRLWRCDTTPEVGKACLQLGGII